ncbi:C-C motif chemokine 20-like [Chiloscyllium plagiosum]|uniref:C-C motif chemokine 20-like n=1 Tax=Chiloscyllium plagiosum TaxID=36176 RepID=UPI001CB7D34D|nr:C-C motif chemokine 20-like [Chiloscyllium plagiosum]
MYALRKLLLVTVLSLLTLGIVNFSVSAHSMYSDCCLGYSKGRLPLRKISGYVEQQSNEICDIDAIIFYTVGGRAVCTDPENKWVKRALRYLSKKLEEMSYQD